MSNYALQNQLHSLESELRQAQQIHAELCSELQQIALGVGRAVQDLEEYNGYIRSSLDHCNSSMVSSHQRVIDALQMQGEIERLYVKFKQIELANKKIRACNNKKYYDFSNYRTVRKIVQGMMDNLDVQMVSDQTITKSIEIQHLQTPDYWLTCVLISIMAWRNDDRELAERAVARAVQLDKKDSAVFYMLFHLRMEREETALQWFNVYQECELKGSDQRTFLMLFSLISKTIAGQVDEQTRNEVFAFIQKVIDSNRKAAGYREEDILAQIEQYLVRLQPFEQPSFPLLKKHCGAFEELASIWLQAKNNLPVLEFIRKIVHVPPEQRNTFLKEYLDELIAGPNEVEKEVYDEIAYNEYVIRLEGEVEEAKRQFAEDQAKKANDLNLIAEMIDWIYERDREEVNGQIRLNLFTLTKGLQEKAVELHVNGYRSRRKSVYPVQIDGYTAEVDFKREEDACAGIADYFTEQTEEAKKRIKNWKAWIGFGIGAAAGAGAFFAGAWLLVFLLAGIGFGVGTLLMNRSRKKELQQQCTESIRRTTDVMRNVFREFREYQQEVDEYDGYYSQIANEFSQI